MKNTQQYLSVKPVVLLADTHISFKQATFENDNIFKGPVFLAEEKTGFVADKDVFIDPDEASRALKPIAEYLIYHPSITFMLVGITAGMRISTLQ